MIRLFLGLAALALVSACGIKNGLERPDPLWNGQSAIEHECARERAYNADHPAHPDAHGRAFAAGKRAEPQPCERPVRNRVDPAGQHTNGSLDAAHRVRGPAADQLSGCPGVRTGRVVLNEREAGAFDGGFPLQLV